MRENDRWDYDYDERRDAPWESTPRRRGGGGRGFVLFLCLLICITSLAVTLRLTQRFSPSGSDHQTEEPSVSVPATIPTDGPLGTDELERAPTGDGTVLTISAVHTGELTLQEIYKKAIPSVVSVTCYATGSQSIGTGVIFSSDGYILTNQHVIDGGTRATVTLQDERSFDALLVGADSQNDLAVLKIDATGLTPAEFGDSSLLEVGDTAVAIGNPLGTELRGTMTDGIISAINRNVNVSGRMMTLIQTNAALNSGNSGGPLLNVYGQVVGINTMKMMSSYTSTVEGLGFAIPISTAKPIVDELIASGRVEGRPALGITVYTISEGEAAFYNTDAGVYVESVDERSDAYTAGLRAGDRILSANDTDIASSDDLELVKEGLAPGDTITLKVLRNGEELTIPVTLMDQTVFED
ncbi:MAG TPA: trypsin-like peptidase domain-containing protein [Oscillospiraceae bacterium]|nr:trypsin-like peptidase domain-containing protein [Oscillospiraceae bacterium]